MTVKALTGLAPEWYTPQSEAEESEPSQFQLKPLTAPQVAKVQQHFNSETGEVSGLGLYEAAVLGVIAWRNVTDHEGKALPFSKRALDTLPYAIVLELGGQVLASSFLTGEDEKNLS